MQTKVLSIIPLLYLYCPSPPFTEKTQRIKAEDELSDISDEKEVPKISYTISTFSLEELKKPVTRRKPRSRLIDLSSDLEWVDIKAHLKIVICDQLFPQEAVVEDNRYEMTWCIPASLLMLYHYKTQDRERFLVQELVKHIRKRPPSSGCL